MIGDRLHLKFSANSDENRFNSDCRDKHHKYGWSSSAPLDPAITVMSPKYGSNMYKPSKIRGCSLSPRVASLVAASWRIFEGMPPKSSPKLTIACGWVLNGEGHFHQPFPTSHRPIATPIKGPSGTPEPQLQCYTQIYTNKCANRLNRSINR